MLYPGFLHVFSGRVGQDTGLPEGNGSLHLMWTVNLPERDIICSISQTHLTGNLSFEEDHIGWDPTEFTWGNSELEKQNAPCSFNSSHSTATVMRATADDFPCIWQGYEGLNPQKSLAWWVLSLSPFTGKRRWLGQGHMAGRWQCWVLTPGLAVP